MTNSGFKDPLAALRFATIAIGRSTGFRVEGAVRDDVLHTLEAGYARLEAEDQLPAFDNAVTTLINNLIAELPRSSDVEYRGGDKTAARQGSPLPAAAVSDALRSICPLWPFC